MVSDAEQCKLHSPIKDRLATAILAENSTWH
jgi:hypothetical protein